MNIRQQLYKKNRFAGMNEYNAARAAGYSENYSRNARPEKVVKGCLADTFERAGLTDKAIVVHALKGLEANKVISCNVVAPNGESMSDAHGTTKDFIDVPDWGSRHKYFETILKLTDRLQDRVAVDLKGEAVKVINIIHNNGKPEENLITKIRGQSAAVPE